MSPRIVPFALLTLICVGCLAVENSLLYHPVPSTDDTHVPLPLEDIHLTSTDGNQIHARWCPRPNADGALLYCPGNAGNLDHRAQLVRELCDRLNVSVLIFDYPGYGRSSGQPGEAGLYAAADAAYEWLAQRRPADRILLYGESLGGAVAVEQASRHKCRALILARTFASLPDVAQAHFSSSARLLVTGRYDSATRLAKCQCPVFIAQADHDRIIPYAHGEKLRQACGKSAELYTLRGLDHNDPLPAEFYERLRGFLGTIP